MNDGSVSISLFERNKEIEERIDRKFAIHCSGVESITLYFDILDEFIIEFNHRNDPLCMLEINKYISKWKKLYSYGYEIWSDIYYTFNNQEIDYLKSAKEYIENLKSSNSVGKQFDMHSFIMYIMSFDLKNTDVNNLKLEVVQYVSNYDYIKYQIDIKFGNLYVYFLNFDYCIAVISSSDGFVMVNRRWFVSLIVVDDVSTLASQMQSFDNILYIYYNVNNGCFNCIDIRKPFDWCLKEIEGLFYCVKVNQPDLQSELLSASELARSLNKIALCYKSGKYNFKERDIRLLRYKLIKILNSANANLENMTSRLIRIIKNIEETNNTDQSKVDLRKNISVALSEIKKNNTLYIVSKGNKKNEDYAFGEENLTAILASNLRCLYYPQKNVSVYCEAMVGNGRSDVCLSAEREIFGLIEAKLITKNSNVEAETRNAIDQLFSRYSENESIDGSASVSLYLIIFAYDKDFKSLAESIQSAIISYSNRNDLVYERIDNTENGIKFLYKENRNNFGFMDKIRVIDIMVCNMEIDYKTSSKQRTQNKSYNPTRST